MVQNIRTFYVSWCSLLVGVYRVLLWQPIDESYEVKIKKAELQLQETANNLI